MKKLTSIFLFISIMFGEILPVDIDFNALKQTGVQVANCLNKKDTETCICQNDATGKQVCYSSNTTTKDDLFTAEQKFILGLTNIIKPYTEFQKKVLEKSLNSLSENDLNEIKDVFSSYYDLDVIDPESVTSIRDKLRSNIDSDIGSLIDPTGNPKATQTLDDVIKGMQVSHTTDFFIGIAQKFRSEKKKLADKYGMTENSIDAGSVILNLIIKLVMAASGTSLDYTDKLNDMYYGQVKLPFCYMDRWFEFDLKQGASVEKQGTRTEDWGTINGVRVGSFELPKLSLIMNTTDTYYKGKKYSAYTDYLKRKDNLNVNKEIYPTNYIILNATSNPELSWAKSTVYSTLASDYFANKDHSGEAVYQNSYGLRSVLVNRGDMRRSELNIFTGERSLLNDGTKKTYHINCTPSIVSITNDKVLVQEYVIPRDEWCSADETAYCTQTFNKFVNKIYGFSIRNYNLQNIITAKCKPYIARVNRTYKCGLSKCHYSTQDCYVSAKVLDNATGGTEYSSRGQCYFGQIINVNSEKKANKEGIYSGLNIMHSIDNQKCEEAGLYY